MALTRRDIIDEAMSILSRYGLADLSMRRLATGLGVRPGALYWHFENKQQLLAALAGEVLSPVMAADPAADGAAEADPAKLVIDWANGFRTALLGIRDGAELVSSALAMRLLEPSPIASMAARLSAAGAEPRVATAVAHFVLGAAAQEQSHAQLVEFGLAESADTDATGDFQFGLSLLLKGIGA